MIDYVGQKLGNYRIMRRIGRGGFADVYLGEHVYLKTPAAIKVLHMQLSNETLKKFLLESRMIARLDHPNIVRVLDFGIENMTPFLVMNYAAHGTLRQRHPFGSTVPAATIVSYVRSVTDALQYAHDCKIIHRDVKPENILIGQNQSIMLSDFGLALAAHSVYSAPTQSSQHIKGTAGTTTYMAPEQFDGKPCRASDQYALGIVVYEWFCGEPPFQGPDMEIAVQHLYREPPSLREKMPALPRKIDRVVMRALAKNPQQRFASVKEFAQALEAAVASEVPSFPIEIAVPSLPFQNVQRIGELHASVGENSLHSLPLAFVHDTPLKKQFSPFPSFLPQQHVPTTVAPTALTEPATHRQLMSSFALHFPGGRRKNRVRWLILAGVCLIALLAISLLPLFTSPHSQMPVIPAIKTKSIMPATQKMQLETQTPVTPTAVQVVPIAPATAPPQVQPSTLLTVSPTQFSRATCVTANSNYRCTATLSLSTLFKGNLTWSASTTGMSAQFNPASGTMMPGQTNQVIIYVTNDCTFSGSFVFTGGGETASAPWHC